MPSNQEAAVRVKRAMNRGVEVILSTQRPQGDWDSNGDMGPLCTAHTVMALRYVEQLTEDEKRDAARWLKSQQLDDGSYRVQPFALGGDPVITAAAWGALRACDLPPNDPAVLKAWEFVQRNGGMDTVLDGFNSGDPTAIFLAMIGLLDPFKIPKFPISYVLFPRLMRKLEKKVHGGILMMMSQYGVIVRRLRGEYNTNGTPKTWLQRKETKKVRDLLVEFQNEDGGWNCITIQTIPPIAALYAMGTPADDPVFKAAIGWVKKQRLYNDQGLYFSSIMTGVWSTAFNLRALMLADVPADNPAIQKALRWLHDSQARKPQPDMNNRKPDAPKFGGWPFQAQNQRMPDTDDTGVVLSTFGMALNSGLVPEPLAKDLRRASQEAFAWLDGMQNPDGGWGSYVWDLLSKKPGPCMTKPVFVPADHYVEMIGVLMNPPVALGDPATEDVVARIIHGLGSNGYNASHPISQKAIEFLRYQQCDNNSFWGRWAVSYLPTTAFVLAGLAQIKYDLQQPWVQNAIQFVLDHQNSDGGWGETYLAYRDYTQAGIGHSMPTLTGLVVYALVEAGLANSPAVVNGIEYLVTRQRPDGTWPNNAYAHTFLNPDWIFNYIEAPRFYTVMALGSYLNATQSLPIGPVDPEYRPGVPSWNDEFMEKRRLQTDLLGDEIVAEIFAEGKIAEVNRLYALMIKSDDPVPAGLPAKAAEYFNNPSPLPAWADFNKINRAQILFTKYGWEVAMALFCSALPQAYTAAKGAHALIQTHSMFGGELSRRIFETAQFIFDTMDIGGLGPNGRGIRAAQKVRLMHATIRKLLASDPNKPWDTAKYGIPINQEDLAGTLMTFSCVIIDALRRIHVDIDDQGAEDWLHTWKVIGHIMGVESKMIPKDFADGKALMNSIRRRQWAPSDDGKILARALVGMMQDYFPGRFMDNMPVSLIRYLSGDHCADMLGLPASDWTRHLVGAGALIEDLLRRGKRNTSRAALIDYAVHLLMEGVVKVERKGKSAKFRIPSSLTHSLGPDTN